MPKGADLLGTHLMFSGSAVTKLPFINTVMPSLSPSPCAKGNATSPNASPINIDRLLTEIPIQPLLSFFDLFVWFSPAKWYHLNCHSVGLGLARSAGRPSPPAPNNSSAGDWRRRSTTFHTAWADIGS